MIKSHIIPHDMAHPNRYLREKVPTGIPGLDVLLWGGLLPGSLTLVSGGIGSGKSALAWQFLVSGADNDEKGLLISIGRDEDEQRDWTESFDWQAGEYLKNEELYIRSMPSKWNTRTAQNLTKLIEKQDIKRVVIDAVDPSIAEKEDDFIKWIKSFNTWRKKIKTCTLLMKQDAQEFEAAGIQHPSISCEIAMNLGIFHIENKTVRALWVTKMSGGAHSEYVHELMIDEKGLQIGRIVQPGRSFQGMESREQVLRVSRGAGSYIQIRQSARRMTEEFIQENPLVVVEDRDMNNASHLWEEIHRFSNSWEGLSLICLPDQVLRRHLNEDLFMPLDDVIGKNDRDRLLTEAWWPYTYDNTVYGICNNIEIGLVWCRGDLLKKHGLQVPNSWEEMLTATQRVLESEKDDELQGICLTSGGSSIDADQDFSQVLLSLLGSAGHDLEKLVLNSDDEKLNDSLRFLEEARDTGAFGKGWLSSNSPWEGLERWFKGKCLFLFSSSDNYFIQQTKKTPFNPSDVVAIPMPMKSGVSSGKNWRNASVWAIPRSAPDPELAVRYLRYWLLTMEKRAEEFSHHAYLPLVAPYENKSLHKSLPAYREGREWIEESTPIPLVKNFIYWTERQRAGLQDLLHGVRTREEICKDFAIVSKLCDNAPMQEVVSKALHYLQIIPLDQITVEALAKECYVTPRYLHHLMNQELGITPQNLVLWWKMEKAKQYLKDTSLSIQQISRLLGYQTEGSFSRAFKGSTNHRPGEYKNLIAKLHAS